MPRPAVRLPTRVCLAGVFHNNGNGYWCPQCLSQRYAMRVLCAPDLNEWLIMRAAFKLGRRILELEMVKSVLASGFSKRE